jgi:hypothetical protein
VWTPRPPLLRNALVPVDRVTGPVRRPVPGQVKRIGADQRLHPSPATIEVATAAKNRELLLGPPGAQRVGNWFQGQLNRPGPGGIQPARSHDRKIRNNRSVHAAPGSTSIAGPAFPDEPDEPT